MTKFTFIALALMAAGLSGQAMAETVAPATAITQAPTAKGDFGQSSTPYSKIDSLNSEIGVLQAQLEAAKLKASIKKATDEADGKDPRAPVSTQGPAANGAPAAMVMPQESLADQIRVTMISGIGKDFTARLAMPSGRIIDAHKGSRVTDKIRVVSVTGDGVILNESGKTRHLYYSDSPQSFAPAASGPANLPTNIGQRPSPAISGSVTSGGLMQSAPRAFPNGAVFVPAPTH